MTSKEYIDQLNHEKEGLSRKLHSKATSVGFKQAMKRLVKINNEIQRIAKEK